MKPMRLLLVVMLAATLAGPREAESCGPVSMRAQFSFVAEPPQGVFSRGQLGILRPSYWRRYLVVAYRYLTGAPLNQQEAETFASYRGMVEEVAPPDAPERWIEARKRVPGVPAIEKIDPDRTLHGSYESYPNCLDTAFDNAAKTLAERANRWGASSPLLSEWVRGQDAVFQNCHEGRAMPAVLPAGADALLSADRRYQIAAAEFYSEQYEAAENDFGAIARDADSPWKDLGELMVARTLIREATVGEKTAKLADAQRALDAIVARGANARFRKSALGLREFVASRVDPDAQLAVLSKRLMRPESGPEFSRSLTDFTMIWDKKNAAPNPSTELTDWIATFQGRNWQHALEQWQSHASDAWLVAALASVPKDNPAVPELLKAAHGLPATNRAWASAVFYGISLKLARDEDEAARRWVDEALANQQPANVNNEFLAQRMTLVRNWEEFLRYGPRAPVAVSSWGADEPLAYGGPEFDKRKVLFDSDFTEPLNRETPLQLWVDATSSKLLPADLQADIAQAGWVRAIILDRAAEAQALGARLVTLRTELRHIVEAWLREKDPKAAKFQAVMAMLNTPGLQPAVRDNFGRITPVKKLDEFRDNWWDISDPKSPTSEPRAKRPPFLPATERAEGSKEWQQLQDVALRAPDYLCGEVLAWARAHPEDPRSPEALHLAVRTTRFTNSEHTTTNPKQAFTLLHRKYPKSKWAALTPYWY